MEGQTNIVLRGNERGPLTEPLFGTVRLRVAHHQVEKKGARQVSLVPDLIRGGVLPNNHAAWPGGSSDRAGKISSSHHITSSTTCQCTQPTNMKQIKVVGIESLTLQEWT